MKTYIKSVLVVLFGMTMALGLAACGGGDSNGGDGDGVSVPPSASYNSENLVGVWSGVSSNSVFKLAFAIYDNNRFQYSLLQYNSSSGTYQTTMQESGSYYFDTNTGELKLAYSDNSTETLKVSDQTYSSFTLTVGQTIFYMTRYTGSGDSGGTGGETTTDYAPSSVTEKHIHIGLHSYSLDLYFASNYSLDMTYSRMTTPFTLVSASYSKTGTNSATVSYTWSGTTGTFTSTVDLTFTSETGGTAKGDAVSGTFTIEDFSRSSSAEAPTSIAYKTLHVPYATDTWFKFGSQSGTRVAITSHSGSVSYSTIYATYLRSSSTSATITIHKNISSYTSEQQDVYILDFYTSTSGKYKFTANRGSYGTSSWTGDFTLE